MGKEHLQQKPALNQHWIHVSNILVTFYMNKIYYVLYIVKTLPFITCCPSQKKGIIASLEVTVVLQWDSRVCFSTTQVFFKKQKQKNN